MLFAFVVDTSLSMNSSFSRGLSSLDAAKATIEHFFKWDRNRKTQKKNQKPNKYMLVTYGEPDGSSCIQHELSTEIPSLLDSVKRIQATQLSQPQRAFKETLEYLHCHRIALHAEECVHGRSPAAIESTIIVWLTDGEPFTNHQGEHFDMDLNISPQDETSFPGASSYAHWSRWDQKVFTFVLNAQGKPYDKRLSQLVENMNGQVWQFHELIHVKQSIENCLDGLKDFHQVPPDLPLFTYEGVTVIMEPDYGSQTSEQPQEPSKVFIHTNARPFPALPIPEPLCMDNNGTRPIFPRIKVNMTPTTITAPQNFPFDRYTIEKTPLILELAKRRPHYCWLLSMPGPDNKSTQPFGYLKFSSTVNDIVMYIFPYDFTTLMRIYDMAGKPKRSDKDNAALKEKIDSYMSKIPPHLIPKLEATFSAGNVRNVIPSGFAKHIAPLLEKAEAIKHEANARATDLDQAIKQRRTTHLQNRHVFSLLSSPQASTLSAPSISKENHVDDTCKNIIDNCRKLLDFSHLPSPSESDTMEVDSPAQDPHAVPISVMTDYTRHFGRFFGLRDALEDPEVQQFRHQVFFGNPYRTDMAVGIDEADEANAQRRQAPGTSKDSSLNNASALSVTSSGSARSSLRSKENRLRARLTYKIPSVLGYSHSSQSLLEAKIMFSPFQMSFEQVQHKSFKETSKDALVKHLVVRKQEEEAELALHSVPEPHQPTKPAQPSPLQHEISLPPPPPPPPILPSLPDVDPAAIVRYGDEILIRAKVSSPPKDPRKRREPRPPLDEPAAPEIPLHSSVQTSNASTTHTLNTLNGNSSAHKVRSWSDSHDSPHISPSTMSPDAFSPSLDKPFDYEKKPPIFAFSTRPKETITRHPAIATKTSSSNVPTQSVNHPRRSVDQRAETNKPAADLKVMYEPKVSKKVDDVPRKEIHTTSKPPAVTHPREVIKDTNFRESKDTTSISSRIQTTAKPAPSRWKTINEADVDRTKSNVPQMPKSQSLVWSLQCPPMSRAMHAADSDIHRWNREAVIEKQKSTPVMTSTYMDMHEAVLKTVTEQTIDSGRLPAQAQDGLERLKSLAQTIEKNQGQFPLPKEKVTTNLKRSQVEMSTVDKLAPAPMNGRNETEKNTASTSRPADLSVSATKVVALSEGGSSVSSSEAKKHLEQKPRKISKEVESVPHVKKRSLSRSESLGSLRARLISLAHGENVAVNGQSKKQKKRKGSSHSNQLGPGEEFTRKIPDVAHDSGPRPQMKPVKTPALASVQTKEVDKKPDVAIRETLPKTESTASKPSSQKPERQMENHEEEKIIPPMPAAFTQYLKAHLGDRQLASDDETESQASESMSLDDPSSDESEEDLPLERMRHQVRSRSTSNPSMPSNASQIVVVSSDTEEETMHIAHMMSSAQRRKRLSADEDDESLMNLKRAQKQAKRDSTTIVISDSPPTPARASQGSGSNENNIPSKPASNDTSHLRPGSIPAVHSQTSFSTERSAQPLASSASSEPSHGMASLPQRSHSALSSEPAAPRTLHIDPLFTLGKDDPLEYVTRNIRNYPRTLSREASTNMARALQAITPLKRDKVFAMLRHYRRDDLLKWLP